MINIQIINVINGGSYLTTDRPSFRCLEVEISSDDPFLENVRQEATLINNRLNSHSASAGVVRSDGTVTADNLIGLIAEFACYKILKKELGDKNVVKPTSRNSHNQIDIQLISGKTIEVRSSCIRNGLNFALFSVDCISKKQYIDVIGPYCNTAYKAYENIKDFYMRVIYVGDTASVFSNIINGGNVLLFITGGATKQMLEEIGYRKFMTSPADSRAREKGDYTVVQMSDSFDYPDFIEQLNDVL